MIRTLLRATIHFDARTGEQLHAPMVLAAVGAFDVRLVLDTGSDVHLLTRELCDRAGIEVRGGESGTDHAGTELDSWLAGDIAIRFPEADEPELSIDLRDVVAIPAPGPFEGWGIAGILSPQRLHAEAWTVLDLIDDELWLVDGRGDEIREWLLARRPEPGVLELDRAPGDARPIVSGAVAPHAPVPILVNTGGRHTEFEPGALPGIQVGAVAPIGRAVSGAEVLGASAGRQVLELGDRRIALANLMLREGMSDPPAMIGSDVLRGTVIGVSPDAAGPLLWQVRGLDEGQADPIARPLPGV